MPHLRILFLSHYFPPEVNAPATRTYEHCKVWVEQGHEVTVLTCVPNHPMGKVYGGYRNQLYQVDQMDGIKVIRLFTYVTANEGFLKRTANYVLFMLATIFSAPFVTKADVVISTSPQFFNGLAGYFVSRLKRARWVLEIRDLWPESILAVGAIKNKRLIKVLEWIERFVYRKADHVVAVTHAFKKHIVARGAKQESVSVIRNGVDLSLFVDTEPDVVLEEEWQLRDKFVAAYVGTHGMAHGLETILDAAKNLAHRDDIVFLMVGDGAEREKLLQRKNQEQLTNVVMQGQQPKAMMPKIWAMTDVSLVLLRKLDLFKTVIPSKIFESMAMSKPIILGVEGEVAAIIDESKAGVCIEPDNPRELAAAIESLADNKDLYDDKAMSGLPYVTKQFDRKNLAREMSSIFIV